MFGMFYDFNITPTHKQTHTHINTFIFAIFYFSERDKIHFSWLTVELDE